jgi:single-strand DNA-binding protein
VAAYEMTGTVKVLMDEVTFPSGFNKREFVVTTADDRYPQDIKFECVKDKTAMLNELTVGQQVKVTFDLRGNEHDGRYYTNLSAWRVEAGGEAAAAPADAAAAMDDSFAPEAMDEAPPF